jgi:putative ABC transport system permease protein
MNMATARSYNRGREIGILKVTGSSKRDLIMQFILESVFLSAGGLILALVIVWFALPVFSGFTDRSLTYRMIFEYSIFLKIIGLMMFAGIFAGIYPAFHLASFSPLHLIKENLKNSGGKSRSGYLRNILVVMQYVISIVALICTITILRQLYFVKNTDLGFISNNIINIMIRDPAIQKNPEVLIKELSTNSKIEDITASASLPLTINSNSRGNWEGKPEGTNLNIYNAGIGINFIDFYNLKIVSGRGFSNEYSTDTVNSFIINQTAAKMIGWEDPVGKKFGFGEDMGIVIGVIKDFYFHSLHLTIEPLALSAIGNSHFKETRYISIKIKPGTVSEVRIFIEKKLKELSPHYLNPVSNLTDRIDQMYSTENKLVTIFIFSTALAIILTCLGQYSLSYYTTKSRTKEMVIRKVMGAQSSEVMALFIREIAKWIFVSVLLAWPVAYIIMTKWLQNFAYHVKIGVAVFLLSFFISLLISLIAISYHIIKLSIVNPADMIRYE